MVIEIIFFGAGVAKKHKTLYEVRGGGSAKFGVGTSKKRFFGGKFE